MSDFQTLLTNACDYTFDVWKDQDVFKEEDDYTSEQILSDINKVCGGAPVFNDRRIWEVRYAIYDHIWSGVRQKAIVLYGEPEVPETLPFKHRVDWAHGVKRGKYDQIVYAEYPA